MNNQIEKIVKCLRIHNGFEFYFTEFNEFCRDEGIERQELYAILHNKNGVVERMNKTLLERARCMLSNYGLTRSF